MEIVRDQTAIKKKKIINKLKYYFMQTEDTHDINNPHEGLFTRLRLNINVAYYVALAIGYNYKRDF